MTIKEQFDYNITHYTSPTIEDYEKKIIKIKEEIENNLNNSKYYERNKFYGNGETCSSPYENAKALLKFYNTMIKELEEKERK